MNKITCEEPIPFDLGLLYLIIPSTVFGLRSLHLWQISARLSPRTAGRRRTEEVHSQAGFTCR